MTLARAHNRDTVPLILQVNSLTGDQRLFAKSTMRFVLHFTLFSDGAGAGAGASKVRRLT